MSKAKFKQFNQEFEQDSALQERLNQAKDKKSIVAVVTEIAQEKGYDLTKEEVKKYVDWLVCQQEITEEQLESIAGGAAKTDMFPPPNLDLWRC